MQPEEFLHLLEKGFAEQLAEDIPHDKRFAIECQRDIQLMAMKAVICVERDEMLEKLQAVSNAIAKGFATLYLSMPVSEMAGRIELLSVLCNEIMKHDADLTKLRRLAGEGSNAEDK